jgi:multidrug resistance protein, MATE family
VTRLPYDNPQFELRPDEPGAGLREVLRLSLPAALTMLGPMLIRFVDAIMVSQLGGDTGPWCLNAQGVAAMTAFSVESFFVGLISVLNTFVGQSLGAGRLDRCGRYAWSALWACLLPAAVEASLALFAGPIFRLYGHPEHLFVREVMYFRYMVLAAFLTLPGNVLETFLFGVQRPGIVFLVSLVTNAVNIVANYALVFGHWGFPRLELQGSALASVTAWTVRLAMLLGVFLSGSIARQFGTRRNLRPDAGCVRDLLRVGWPAGVAFVNDVFPWTLFQNSIVAVFGEAHLAATAIAFRYIPLSFMPAIGISAATTAIAGRYIGMGRPDLARKRTHTALRLALVYMGLCGLVMGLFGEPLMRFFIQLDPAAGGEAAATALRAQIISVGRWVMVCAAFFQLFDAIGIVYSGALRGAGDTRWPMIVLVCLSWGLVAGGGYAMARLFPSLGSIGPWLAGSAYVVCLGAAMAWRFESGAWAKIRLVGGERAG